MRKSLVLLLTFFLTSYSKFGNAFQFGMNELETTVTITEDECLNVLENGNLIASAFRDITSSACLKLTPLSITMVSPEFLGLLILSGT